MSFIPFPPLSPEIFAIDIGGFHLALRWYALAYIAGLIGRVAADPPRAAHTAAVGRAAVMTEVQLESLLTWVIFGVILGGRLGYVLFYQPASIWAIRCRSCGSGRAACRFTAGFWAWSWRACCFAGAKALSLLPTGDLMAMVAPLGLFLGRVANFINAELWGRATDLPWGVVFPGEAALCGGCGLRPPPQPVVRGGAGGAGAGRPGAVGRLAGGLAGAAGAGDGAVYRGLWRWRGLWSNLSASPTRNS